MAEQIDLFGYPEKKKRDYYRIVLAKYDRKTIDDRLQRLKWLNRIFPKGYWFAMSIETSFIFDEAKMTYLNGEFISTILLVTAFIEHWLTDLLISKGFRRESRKGLKSILDCLKANQMLNDYMIENVDRIRELRNPFVHMKPFENANRLEQRSYFRQKMPSDVLKNDAEKALSIMYQVAITKFS